MIDRRGELLDEMDSRDDKKWRERFAPGTHGCHEALHTASVIADMLEDHLTTHPAVVANPEWFALAEKATDAVYALYQAIGAEHM